MDGIHQGLCDWSWRPAGRSAVSGKEVPPKDIPVREASCLLNGSALDAFHGRHGGGGCAGTTENLYLGIYDSSLLHPETDPQRAATCAC
jgi:hypothetical protein